MLFTDLSFQGPNVAGVLVVLAVSTVAFIGLGADGCSVARHER